MQNIQIIVHKDCLVYKLCLLRITEFAYHIKNDMSTKPYHPPICIYLKISDSILQLCMSLHCKGNFVALHYETSGEVRIAVINPTRNVLRQRRPRSRYISWLNKLRTECKATSTEMFLSAVEKCNIAVWFVDI